MPLYFFHLRDGTDTVLDPEGVQLADMKAVRFETTRAARDTLSHGLVEGTLDLRSWIDVETADGAIVHTLHLENSYKTICKAA
jgi:hypothetical protein